jgi:hypothetical protein
MTYFRWNVLRVNAGFRHERLPKSRFDILDVGHFTWEDGADEYAPNSSPTGGPAATRPPR